MLDKLLDLKKTVYEEYTYTYTRYVASFIFNIVEAITFIQDDSGEKVNVICICSSEYRLKNLVNNSLSLAAVCKTDIFTFVPNNVEDTPLI
jgi:hypothetical protein